MLHKLHKTKVPAVKLTGSRRTKTLSLVLDARDPLANARRFLGDQFKRDGRRTFHHHRGEFYTWAASHYRRLDVGDLRAQLYEFLEGALVWRKDERGLEPFRPTKHGVDETLDALRSAAHLPTEIMPSAWLHQVGGPPPSDILPCANGLLRLSDMKLLDHNSEYFCTSASPVAFAPHAAEPSDWLAFLSSVWDTDTQAIETLQEAFGYWLTTDTSQQKIFLLVGPKRSGKGTIARVLGGLLGKGNIAAPTLGSLGSNFGLAPLIGKPLAIISDARLSGRSDQAAIVERLLSISGEDLQTIDRKHRKHWVGALPTRFLLLTNELPRLADVSGAMASRFVVLTLRTSFYGREDTGLIDRLLGELPGILRWSLDGLQRLRERGRFVQPESSIEAVQQLEDLGSPVGAFVRECCTIDPGLETKCDHLWKAWEDWCSTQGRDRSGTRQTFGRDLRAVAPGLVTTQRRRGRMRIRFYKGISLT